MTKQQFRYLIYTAILFILAGFLFKNTITRGDSSLTVSESENDLSISVDFPRSKSENIQKYLRSRLNLSDLTDLDNLEIKTYRTPDHLMTFYIKSRRGSLEILMDKKLNSTIAYNKMKEVGQGLDKVLTN